MQRTDFSSEIDGAFLQRNLGQRHFSEVARSGNGDMRTDLRDTSYQDYEELDGMGEGHEETTREETAEIDTQGSLAQIAKFRWPKPGETPPFASKPDKVWLRRRVITGVRKPGGNRVVKLKWVQVTKERLVSMKAEGQLNGLGDVSMTTVGVSVGAGLVGGLALWFLLRRKKK